MLPITERSELKGETPAARGYARGCVALLTEGALSPTITERSELKGETPAALLTEGALSPFYRE